MLKINNLNAKIGEKEILKGVNLEIPAGQLHVIMGPNGCGKSTLSKVLVGDKNVDIVGGEAYLTEKKLFSLDVHERACEGLFLAFQYPLEIPGVSNMQFLKLALNSKRKYLGLGELDAMDFLDGVKKITKTLNYHDEFLYRSVNEGFSGGEKKINEILQMHVLDPKIAILDEIDSGLDIDALRLVASGINSFMAKQDKSMLIITHYSRLLEYINPDVIHIMKGGKIIKTGGQELVELVESQGYTYL